VPQEADVSGRRRSWATARSGLPDDARRNGLALRFEGALNLLTMALLASAWGLLIFYIAL
jgi:hypothetical protein